MDPRDEAIPSALSAQEWRERMDVEEFRRKTLAAGARVLSDSDKADLLTQTNAKLEREMVRWRYEDAGEDLAARRNLHKAAAIALLDQPFGFNWYDIDILRLAADVVDGYLGKDDMDAIRSISHRIAVMLPPRE